MAVPAAEFWQILLRAPKRSLVRYTHPNPSKAPPITVLKSTVVKLTDGNGPCLEVKRDGVLMKKAHPSLKSWIGRLEPGAHTCLNVQYPPTPRKAPMA